jgi:hypothetical protein
MRSWIAVAAMVILVAAPAQAQMGGSRHHQGEDKRAEPKKPQVDEKAYKAALDHIPEPKDKYDPWGVARPSQPDKSKAK